MSKKKPKRYYNVMYRQHFSFYIGWSRKAFTEYLIEFYEIDPEVEEYEGICMELICDDKHEVLVWTAPSSGKDKIQTILHECIHAAIRTLEARGIKTTGDNQEPLAYLTEYLFGVAYE
jgi:hypothetical protein